MISHHRTALALTTLAATLGGALVLASGPVNAAPGDNGRGQANDSAVEAGKTYDRFIVHFDTATSPARDDASARGELNEVGRSQGHALSLTRRLSTGGVLLNVDSRLDADQAKRLMAAFAQRATVDYVEPDVQMTATMTPNDPEYLKQWHYSEALGGMNLPAAWDTADGAGVTVAVIDTGITPHPDLSANVVAGYDFISNSTEARDGNGRDSNPNDEGDWYNLGDCLGANPPSGSSSWHGTHVAGTIAAQTGNASGVSGVAFNAKVQPVRVLGRCGGTLADISDAVTWASGGTVTGIPVNPTPAKVINMSLGGSGTCGAAYQNAINGAVARGTTVVVAAGNSAANAANYQPASCANTVVVAASDRQGNLASYSNYGAIVDVTAPGGETATLANGVLSTLNTGTTTQAAPTYKYYQGTSMATPHVAGLAALILGEQSMTPAAIESTLKSGTRPLPGTCSGGCGAGLADATKTIGSLGGATPSPSASASPSPSPSASPSPTASPTSSPSPSPTSPPPAPVVLTNGTDYAINDKATVESPITVDRSGAAPAALKVDVTIAHPSRGDLQIDLVAPDGSLYRLKNASKNDAGAFGSASYTVNASAEAAQGVWRLRVLDKFAGSTGTLDTWSLTI